MTMQSLSTALPRVQTLPLMALIAPLLLFGLSFASRIAPADGPPPGDGARGALVSREVSQAMPVARQDVLNRFPAETHQAFLRQAIANSRHAGVEQRTGGAFGAVIVDRSGRVVGSGSNHVVANHDPTWHAEIEAIRDACKRLEAIKLDGCILYTSSEPCPMCLAAAYWAGVDGIIFGATVDDAKTYGGFDDAFIYEQLRQPLPDRRISQTQMLQDEAVKVWKEYASQTDNVPY
jgi:tRNA(Arg) A34 adenosine deaminase TadA